MAGVVRIEPLNAENYDTWKLHMCAVLIKNDLWAYVNGNIECPDDAAGAVLWKTNDQKACADIMLAISPAELNLIAECSNSRKMWQKLQATFESKGPARKATLLKRVALSRMKDTDLVRNHLNDFFDAVAKLKEIGVEIGDDLLAILLLYSLPDSYETFRCALETRDDLPKPDILRVKILEEWESRKAKNNRTESDALYVKNMQKSNTNNKNKNSNERYSGEKRVEQKRTFCCFKCGKSGHYARDCRSKNQTNERANKSQEKNSSLRATESVFLWIKWI